MGDISIVDIFLSVKKRLDKLIIIMIAGAVASYFTAGYFQSYTAGVSIQYTNEGSERGLSPNGEPLNPYELMTPSLISTALGNIGEYNMTVENVRNKLSVSEVIETTTQEIIKASAEKGEQYQYYVRDYLISFSYAGKYGAEFGKNLLYNILSAYDDYFIQKYYNKINIANFLNSVEAGSIDYMELCAFIGDNLKKIIENLTYLQSVDGAFRSSKNGMTFSDLIKLYTGLENIDYEKYYANVRQGHLTKNLDTLTALYGDKIEATRLLKKMSEDESSLSREMVGKFYEQYKNTLDVNADSGEVPQNSGYGDGGDKNDADIVYDIDFPALINTYDDMLLRYLGTGVTAADYEYDIEFYQKIIDDFSSDGADMGSPKKKALLAENEEIYSRIYSALSDYASLANEAINEYYSRKVASDIVYTTSIDVSGNISTGIVIITGTAISAMAACAAFIFIDVIKRAAENRKTALAAIAGTASAGMIDAKRLENMTEPEFLLYRQFIEGFPDIYLALQPVVSDGGEWKMAEALMRWNGGGKAELSPMEIIRAAQKYDFMESLELHIIRLACACLKRMALAGLADIKLGVNYSVAQIEKPTFIDSLWRAASETGVDPGSIYIEISGGGDFSDLNYIKKKLLSIKKTGVKIAVDRFGESFNSLRALYELPVDMVKISRDYIDGVEKNGAGPFIRDTHRICRSLGIEVCMLGVENAGQAKALAESGINYMQGYYFSAPMKEDEFIKRMKQREERKFLNNVNKNFDPGTDTEPDGGSPAG